MNDKEKKLVQILEQVLEFMKVQDGINKALDKKLEILNVKLKVLEDNIKENDDNE